MTLLPDDPLAQPVDPQQEQLPTNPVRADGSDKEGSSEAKLDTAPQGPSSKNKKRSQRKKKKKKNAKPLATGFEEYFADVPVTPQEAVEEAEDLYHPDTPFHLRIETCLQRFRSRRRIQDKIAKYFNEYLFLGGIDCSQRAFQGGSGYDFEDTTNAEERELTAVDTLVSTGNPIYYNASDPTHWEVDFTGVVAGYLSRGLHSMAWGRFEDVTLAIGVITNFLRYVLMHNVCPEYEDDINKAIGICKLAEEDEIPRINTINSLLPGQFALACQELYFRDIHPIFYSSSKAGFTRPENFDANGLFVAAIVLAGTPEMVQKMKETKTIRITDEEDQNLEVMSIQRPTPEVSDLFRRMLPAEGDAHFAPIGTVTCKNIRVESEYDLGAVKLQMPLGGDETLFMDDEILKKLKPGLQLTGTLCTLNIGAKFFRDSPWVSPSYYTFLPQEMMKGYKAPVPNLREAPSALNHEGDDDGGGELSCE